MKKNSRIFIAGENTMEGKALLNFFRNNEYENINNLTHPEPNLREYNSTKKYYIR